MRAKNGKIRLFLILMVLILSLSLTGLISIGEVSAYYSQPYTYSSSRLGAPIFGYSPYGYGTGLFGQMFSPFGFGGSYNLTSSLYGLYGSGLLGGIYGMGGLPGLGLYGMGGFYGLGGLYGLGGSFGLSSLYGGLYGMGGLYGLNALGGLGYTSLLSGLTTGLSAINNPLVAEQAGTWIGTWNLGFLFGTMVMNLKEDPLTGNLTGTAQLIGNNTFAGIFNIFGSGSTTFVILNGQDPTVSYAIIIQGTLTTPDLMNGFYDIYKVGSAAPQETGTFKLDLVTAVVI